MASNFKFKHSEILSLITQSKKEGLITDEERKIMKEFIVNKEPDLTDDLKEYENDKDLRKLVEITQMSSPVDNNLIDRKRKKQQKKKVEQKPKKAEEEELHVEDCEIGCSPQLNFGKSIKRNFDDDDD